MAMRIIISGYDGRMGRMLRETIQGDPEWEIVAGFEQCEVDGTGAPVFTAANLLNAPKADAVIDFSHFSFTQTLLGYCRETKTPVVISTTALGEAELSAVREAAREIAVFRSANMSLGVNLMAKMARMAVPALEKDFDIEIVEKHHNKKADAPSGTAILLADAVNEAASEKKNYVYGRNGKDALRAGGDLGIHAVRAGTIPGQHTLLFAGPDEVIEITHTVYSRRVFALGALAAARFLPGKAPGLYSMDDLIG